LYGLARSLKPRVCVEIGSARGKSACYVGMALRDNGSGKLYAIDPHTRTNWNDARSVETSEIFEKNVNAVGVEQYVQMVRKTSEEAARDWDQPIDLLFIDGDHSYEGVRHDWELFSRFLTKFGVTVFHDTIWDVEPDPMCTRTDIGVPRFVDELRREGYPVITSNGNFGVSLVQGARAGIPLVR
jgi:MMP 1-O-methyltransferase